MYTPSKAYVTKISSGTVLALLALSGLLVLVPAALPVRAATQGQPTMAMYPTVFGASDSSWFNYFEVTITNPSSNPYAITEVDFAFPSDVPAATVTAIAAGTTGTALTTCSAVGQSMQCTGTLNPGSSDDLVFNSDFQFTYLGASSYPKTFSLTTEVKDSTGVFQVGPTLSRPLVDTSSEDDSIACVSVDCTEGGINVVAGSTMTIAATWTHQPSGASSPTGIANIPVVWMLCDAAYCETSSTTYLGTLSSRVTMTNSSGIAVVTFKASTLAGDATYITAVFGDFNQANPDATYCSNTCDATSQLTSIAGAPATVKFTAWTATHYLHLFATPTWTGATGDWATVASGGITATVADAFGNAVLSGISAQACTLTAFGGSFDKAGTQSSLDSIVAGASCSTGGAIASTYNYFQSGAYSTTAYVQATVTGTYNSATFTAQGISKNLITSTFDSGASSTPTTSPALSGPVVAGKSVKLTYQLTNAQSGVPITFLGINTTSPYLGKFVGGSAPTTMDPANVTIVTDSTGKAVATFNVDTFAGLDESVPPSAVYFEANVADPIDGSGGATHMLGASAPTGTATTVAAAAAGVMVLTSFESDGDNPTTTSLGGSAQTLYVDVALVDVYGNFASNPSSSQIVITITVSSGAVTAPTTFIAFGETDTYDSFGVISWSFNGAVGSSITITATGTLPGATSPSTNTATISLVSPNPTLTITSPKGSTVYSSFPGVAFSGKVTLSKGYDPGSVTIAGVFYKIDSGSWTGIGATTPFTTAPSFTSGLHTISFFANDSAKDTSATTSLQVLVDLATPTITFTTPANANLTGGSTVGATIVEPLGDLNATAVTATGNSTTKLPVTVSGVNSLGNSVTYTVSISGLTVGTWNVVLNAASLAGNTASKSITVHVTVPFAQSFVVSGTPSKGTLGGYTGINVAYSNLNPTSQSVVIFAVWKNNAAQTVGIGASSATVGAGATTSAFIVEPVGLASGTYTVNLFVFTTSNSPVSVTTNISVTV